MGAPTQGGSNAGAGDFASTDFRDMGSGGSASFASFDDPANVTGDPFFDPVFGSQMMGGEQQGDPARAPYIQDPSQQQGGPQQQQREQEPTSAAGGPRQKGALGQLSTGLQQLSKLLSGNQQRGPSFIQPERPQPVAAQAPQAPQTPPSAAQPANQFAPTPAVHQPQQPQAPQGTEGGGAPAPASPPTAQVSPPPTPPPEAPQPPMAQQPTGGAQVPNLGELERNVRQPGPGQAIEWLKNLISPRSDLQGVAQQAALAGPSPPTAAQPGQGAGPGAAVAQAAPTAAPDTTNKTLLDQLSGKTTTPTMENRMLPQQQPGEPKADVDFLNARGAHSTTTSQGVRGAWGAYMANPDLGRRLADAGRAFEKETGQRATFGEGDRDRAIQGVYRRRYEQGTGGKAARPGHSQHQFNRAMDIPDGPFANWLKSGNARRFGLHNPVSGDPNHFQPFGNYKGSAPMSEAPGKRSDAGDPRTRGERNNNPGNMKRGPDAEQFGATGYDAQGHAIFPTWEAGQQAQASLLRRKYNGMSIAQMAPIYAGAKFAPGWIRGVTKFGGYSPNDVPDMSTPEGMHRLQEAIRKQEGVKSPDERSGGPRSSAEPNQQVAGGNFGPGGEFLDIRKRPPNQAPSINPAKHFDKPSGPDLPIKKPGEKLGANTPVRGETPQPGNPYPGDVGTGAGQLPSGPVLDTIRRLHEQRKRDQGISENPEEGEPYQVAGDVLPFPGSQGAAGLDARRRFQAPGVYQGSRGAGSIGQFGGRQSPTLDLLDILMFPSGAPAGKRSELLEWILQQGVA